MLMTPDPSNEDKFDDFVHTSICSFGIHTHNKTITGRCHKPPKGITCCYLTKPSGLIDCTKPVQHIDITPLQINPSQTVTITYEVSEEVQSRKSALESILPENQVGPTIRENDPRLIVYEPKRPQLPPLPKQEEFATKYWIISQLSHAMMPNKSKNNHTISSNLKTPTEALILQL